MTVASIVQTPGHGTIVSRSRLLLVVVYCNHPNEAHSKQDELPQATLDKFEAVHTASR